jgi:nickel/cobalt transporter (NicO) family protein
MADFAALLQQGSAHAWLFIPSAILLGALHGLEPGHSKTMMAAFIVAIRGTPGQAVLLGLAATVSHTAIVWIIALGGMYLWQGLTAEAVEPHLQLVSGLIVGALAIWMLWRPSAIFLRGEDHAHGHSHTHSSQDHDHGPHGHTHETVWTEGVQVAHEDGDAHARAHADAIRHRFDGRPVTNWQIALFGLTGGLIPCPAAITVLILCLQLKEIALGATLVLSFSIGLALILVAVGVVAAIGTRETARRAPWFSRLAAGAPYFSGFLMLAVAIYMIAHGWAGLGAPNPFQWLYAAQGWIHGELRGYLTGFAKTGDWYSLLAVAPFGVVFGAIHAMTPGHGKAILATYLAGSRLAVLKGVGVAAVLSMTHVGMSVVLALSAAPLIEKSLVGAGRAPLLETASYAILGLIGLWFLVRSILNTGHSHGERDGLSVGFVAGLIPCPLTLFVMIAAVAMGVPGAGLAFAAAMMLGVTLTLGTVAVAVVLMRGQAIGWLERHGASLEGVGRFLDGATGAVLLVLAAAFFRGGP